MKTNVSYLIFLITFLAVGCSKQNVDIIKKPIYKTEPKMSAADLIEKAKNSQVTLTQFENLNNHITGNFDHALFWNSMYEQFPISPPPWINYVEVLRPDCSSKDLIEKNSPWISAYAKYYTSLASSSLNKLINNKHINTFNARNNSTHTSVLEVVEKYKERAMTMIQHCSTKEYPLNIVHKEFKRLSRDAFSASFNHQIISSSRHQTNGRPFTINQVNANENFKAIMINTSIEMLKMQSVYIKDLDNSSYYKETISNELNEWIMFIKEIKSLRNNSPIVLQELVKALSNKDLFPLVKDIVNVDASFFDELLYKNDRLTGINKINNNIIKSILIYGNPIFISSLYSYSVRKKGAAFDQITKDITEEIKLVCSPEGQMTYPNENGKENIKGFATIIFNRVVDDLNLNIKNETNPDLNNFENSYSKVQEIVGDCAGNQKLEMIRYIEKKEGESPVCNDKNKPRCLNMKMLYKKALENTKFVPIYFWALQNASEENKDLFLNMPFENLENIVLKYHYLPSNASRSLKLFKTYLNANGANLEIPDINDITLMNRYRNFLESDFNSKLFYFDFLMKRIDIIKYLNHFSAGPNTGFNNENVKLAFNAFVNKCMNESEKNDQIIKKCNITKVRKMIEKRYKDDIFNEIPALKDLISKGLSHVNVDFYVHLIRDEKIAKDVLQSGGFENRHVLFKKILTKEPNLNRYINLKYFDYLYKELTHANLEEVLNDTAEENIKDYHFFIQFIKENKDFTKQGSLIMLSHYFTEKSAVEYKQIEELIKEGIFKTKLELVSAIDPTLYYFDNIKTRKVKEFMEKVDVNSIKNLITALSLSDSIHEKLIRNLRANKENLKLYNQFISNVLKLGKSDEQKSTKCNFFKLINYTKEKSNLFSNLVKWSIKRNYPKYVDALLIREIRANCVDQNITLDDYSLTDFTLTIELDDLHETTPTELNDVKDFLLERFRLEKHLDNFKVYKKQYANNNMKWLFQQGLALQNKSDHFCKELKNILNVEAQDSKIEEIGCYTHTDSKVALQATDNVKLSPFIMINSQGNNILAKGNFPINAFLNLSSDKSFFSEDQILTEELTSESPFSLEIRYPMVFRCRLNGDGSDNPHIPGYSIITLKNEKISSSAKSFLSPPIKGGNIQTDIDFTPVSLSLGSNINYNSIHLTQDFPKFNIGEFGAFKNRILQDHWKLKAPWKQKNNCGISVAKLSKLKNKLNNKKLPFKESFDNTKTSMVLFDEYYKKEFCELIQNKLNVPVEDCEIYSNANVFKDKNIYTYSSNYKGKSYLGYNKTETVTGIYGQFGEITTLTPIEPEVPPEENPITNAATENGVTP
jgi:hypothetical protein